MLEVPGALHILDVVYEFEEEAVETGNLSTFFQGII